MSGSFVTSTVGGNPNTFCDTCYANELGFILRDHAFSFVEAREVIDPCAECCCPKLVDHCLKLPCDLSGDSLCMTLPLVDVKTGEAFKIQQGALVKQILIAKCPNVCLDNTSCFILGTIGGPQGSCGDNAQRWITESAPVTGRGLNCCVFVLVDATAKSINAALEPCDQNACCPSQTTCDTLSSEDEAVAQEECEDICAPVQCITSGDVVGSAIGITLLQGVLRRGDVTFTVSVWEPSCVPDTIQPCPSFSSCAATRNGTVRFGAGCSR